MAKTIIDAAIAKQITHIINVGTSLIESINCVDLAYRYEALYASVGIHPNDCTDQWRSDIKQLEQKIILDKQSHKKIIAIGECGIDKHYPDYNLQRQQDAFRAHIELALAYQLPVIVHTRQAPDETLEILEKYRKESLLRGVIHCFSEDQSFADEAIKRNFFLGIGGTLTYPKNEGLRAIVQKVSLENIILETDAPFLPPQHMRGKPNSPDQIATIAQFLATLRNETFEDIAQQTTKNVKSLFTI